MVQETTSKQGVDLDELQRSVERTLALLQDRHPGLHTWNQGLAHTLQELHTLSGQALKENQK